MYDLGEGGLVVIDEGSYVTVVSRSKIEKLGLQAMSIPTHMQYPVVKLKQRLQVNFHCLISFSNGCIS